MFCSSDVRNRFDRKIKSDAKTYWLWITRNRHARTNIFQEAQIVVWLCLSHIDSLARYPGDGDGDVKSWVSGLIMSWLRYPRYPGDGDGDGKILIYIPNHSLGTLATATATGKS